MTNIMFDKPTLARFKQAYEKAKADEQTEFTFSDEAFLVSYAHYLIQFLEGRMGLRQAQRAFNKTRLT